MKELIKPNLVEVEEGSEENEDITGYCDLHCTPITGDCNPFSGDDESGDILF